MENRPAAHPMHVVALAALQVPRVQLRHTELPVKLKLNVPALHPVQAMDVLDENDPGPQTVQEVAP